MPNIFEYFDYHNYLPDFYNEKKRVETLFSYRYMSGRLGIDAGYPVKVLQGRKSITMNSVPEFASVLKPGKRETTYFGLPVLFCKARSNAGITSIFEKMLPFTKMHTTKIESHEYEFHRKWYHSANRIRLCYMNRKSEDQLLEFRNTGSHSP